MLDSGVEFDAIFASCDLLAMGAMQALRRRGLDVPKDVSVMGFDDLWVCSSLSPSLSTVRQDTAAAARALVDGLSALIEGQEVADIRLPAEVVVRESCGGLVKAPR
jgi:DNA-binding LacI/PurR family transcriptional regulator